MSHLPLRTLETTKKQLHKFFSGKVNGIFLKPFMTGNPCRVENIRGRKLFCPLQIQFLWTPVYLDITIMQGDCFGYGAFII